MALAQKDFDPGERPRRKYVDRVAVTPIHGTLSNRPGWFSDDCYENLRATINSTVAGVACNAIVLDFDSPGGEAARAMETSRFIRQAAAQKPIVAFVDGMACSAAYALACGAPDVVAAPSATLGSIRDG